MSIFGEASETLTGLTNGSPSESYYSQLDCNSDADLMWAELATSLDTIKIDCYRSYKFSVNWPTMELPRLMADAVALLFT